METDPAFTHTQRARFSTIYPTYDWKNDGGYNNFADWIETAARKAGR
jgi:hypothetical protein